MLAKYLSSLASVSKEIEFKIEFLYGNVWSVAPNVQEIEKYLEKSIKLKPESFQDEFQNLSNF